LLRLLLPLISWICENSIIYFTSSSPDCSPKTSIGRSDGRCGQEPVTQSTQFHELCLLNIPHSWTTIAKFNPRQDKDLKIWRINFDSSDDNENAPTFANAPTTVFNLLFVFIIVCRVRPIVSQGITDLLSTRTSVGLKSNSQYKKIGSWRE